MKLFSRNSFLFPSVGKLLLAALLFYIVGWLIWPTIYSAMLTDYDPVGFPLPIHAHGFCMPDAICLEFSWVGLLIDIIFWYLISSAIVEVKKKYFKK